MRHPHTHSYHTHGHTNQPPASCHVRPVRVPPNRALMREAQGVRGVLPLSPEPLHWLRAGQRARKRAPSCRKRCASRSASAVASAVCHLTEALQPHSVRLLQRRAQLHAERRRRRWSSVRQIKKNREQRAFNACTSSPGCIRSYIRRGGESGDRGKTNAGQRRGGGGKGQSEGKGETTTTAAGRPSCRTRRRRRRRSSARR
jgi:hypothetical protein